MKLPYHPLELYEASVQDPISEMKFFEKVFKQTFKKRPLVLREDFCATFRNACQWIKMGRHNCAHAVDLDEKTLEYGKNKLDHLSIKEQARLFVYPENVLSVDTPPVDILSISNFSIGYLKKREDLLFYMQNNYRHLKKQGMVIFDLLGGQEISVEQEEKRTFSMPDKKRVKYIWEHACYDPITHDAVFYIHYEILKKRFEKVFAYHWRMWSIPEMRDVLLEAGFDDVKVYWEKDDEDGDPSGDYAVAKRAEDCSVWIAYVVGIKK